MIIEGPLLAREYLNDPVKTANSFITDPAFVQQLGISPNRRMYRTGDLVQQNMDGSLVYLGRRDTQVKIRGQRVEIGEIESHIIDLLPNAREAIVDVIRPVAEDHDISPMLVAVIEADISETEASTSDTRLELYSPSQITQRTREGLDGLDTDLGLVLPAYMVPTVYLLASRLPVNASGKLDRRAVRDHLMSLPRDVLRSFSGLANSKQMPTTPMEQKLQTLYTSTLMLRPEEVGINDSFFRLGGDSVAAMKLTAAAHAQDIPLSVADIFRWPRLVDLAEAMEEKRGHGSDSVNEEDPELFSLWPELQTGATEKSRLLADVAEQCGVSVDEIEDIYPCSPLQAGLMTITAQRPEAYVVQRVFKLQGGISTQKLKAVWARLTEVLPILRTRVIPSVQATALQVVLRETPIWQTGISLEDYLTTDRATPMTYGGALSRTAILEDGSHRHFVWTVHHSIYDGWSMAKMMKMLEEMLSGSELSTPVSVPVSRFIGYLTKKDKDQTAMFWQKHLGGANWTRYPELPSQQHIINPRNTSHRRLRIPTISGSTTFIVLRAAWALLVASNTGADEAVINIVLSGRTAPVKDLLDLVAPTITTVPFHVSTSSGQPVRDFLANIQDQATEMIPHEHTGLQNIRRMVSSLGPDFDPGHIFVVQPAAESESTVANSHLEIEREASSMDAFHAQALTIECTVGQDTRDVEVELRFDDAVIATDNAEQLLDQFSHLVQQLAQNADKELPLSSLQLLSPEQMAQICKWNSSIPSRVDRCIHELVMDQITAQPVAKAVTAWDGDLTYKQLDDLSRRLALHLIETGISPEVMVGVCMSKSKWAVVAMLAVLRAGGVVVPLGTRQPLSRIETIVTDTAAPLILTDHPQEQRLEGLRAHTQLLIVESFFDRTADPAHNTEPRVFARPDNAAWVIYTSGSTGTPKGVVLEHGALATSILGHGTAYGLQADDRILQFAAYTFDAAIQEIMTTLAFGACICIPSEQDRVERLTSFVAENRITMATLTSTVAALIRPQETPTVRTIILVGEAVQANVVDQWLQQATVINGYGPSECSIASTCREIQNSSSALNIGTAIAGGLWVVKPASTELAAFRSPGELLIDGPLLARGYLNDPAKTAAAFITDAGFLKKLGLSGRRLYRTGDLVQQNLDGSLTYLGRIDTQIKIRGQRVEIGEIESQIEKHPTVRDAVVLYPRQGPLANRLVATVVLDETSTGAQSTTIQQISQEHEGYANIQFHEIQRILSEKLVYYMIPSVWVPLAAVPVNMSGKTDRLAISRWVQSLTEDEVTALTSEKTEDIDEESTTAVERQLRQIWSEVLDVPLHKITYTTTKFFSLGGDSITAMQVVSACRARGILVTVRKVLDYQTIRELATQTQMTEDASSITKIPEGKFQLSPIQQMYFEDIAADGIRADGEHRFNQGVSLHVTRRVELDDLARALDAIVSKHAMLRARFGHDQDGWHQWVEKQVPASYRLCKHTASDAHSMQNIIEHSQASLDLEHGPVFAADLIHRRDMQKEDGQDGQVLHFVAHHLVIDLMSWRILLQDLETLLVHGQPLKMDILSFPTWLERQRQSLSKFLNDNIDTLPVTVPKANWEYWGLVPRQERSVNLLSIQTKCDPVTTSMLLSDAANSALKTEPVEILLAAFYHSFREHFSDRPVPPIFTEGHGREAMDGETNLTEIVGWFTTLSPIYVPPSENNNNAIDVLRQIKDQRRRIPGRGMPYFASRFLIPEGRERYADHGPAEIVFNYLGRFQQLEREDALFRIDNGDDATGVSPVGSLVNISAVLDISVTVQGGELCVNIRFNPKTKHQTTLRQWAQSYGCAVKSLVEELATTAPRATATDFPLAHLSDSDMSLIEDQYLTTMRVSSSQVQDILPCSPIQQGILLTQMQLPWAYLIYQTCRITSSNHDRPLAVDRLVKAWKQVVARHSVLRTVLMEPLPNQEKFVQIVLTDPEIDVVCVDGALDEDAVHWFAKQPQLDLSDRRRPPHRLTTLATTSGEIYCRFDISHALVDASSMTLIIRDLIDAYGNGFTTGGSNYSSYIQFLESRHQQDDLQYWKSALHDAEPCLLSPQDPAQSDGPGKILSVSKRIEDLTMLNTFRDTHGVSIASICQLAWAVVLASWSNSQNISFGNLSSGRDAPIPGVQELVGPMINMLVCHLQLDWNARVSDVARKLQSQSAEAFEHQGISLAAIQHELGLSRGQPLFNSILSYKRQVPSSSGTGEIIFEGLDSEDPTEYDINIHVVASPTDLEFDILYSTTLLSESTASRLADSLIQAVRAISENASRQLGQLSLLPAGDADQICEWNSNMAGPRESCLHDLVVQQMAAHPTAQAVFACDGELTYGDLDKASRQLACYLVNEGVGPEVMIGLCMDKSKWAVVAMLAILRAGGAVVPLGVSHPLVRIESILKDTAAPFIIVDEAQERRLGVLEADTKLININSFFDAVPSAVEEISFNEPCTSVRPSNVAWCVFTSGSTGTPKGVVLEHGALATSIYFHSQRFGLQPGERLLQFAAFTFDATIYDIMAPLSFGGCTCIPSEHDRMNRLGPFISEANVTFAFLTPAVVSLLQPKDVPTIKTLLVGGEIFTSKTIDQWIEHADVKEVYGPTECSIYSTCNDLLDSSQVRNIGKAVAARTWVINPFSNGQLVPISTPGELLIEGPLLARGYLNDPDKTAGSFLVDPAFVKELGLSPGRRFYRTGDLVQQNADGTLQYLDRIGTQVKINGQRLEIGEIESQILLLLPNAKYAYVCKRGSSLIGVIEATSSTSHAAVASSHSIVTPNREQQKSFEYIEASLRERLPSYMIPSAFLVIGSFPLNDNGKLDRRRVGNLLDAIPSDKWLEYTARSKIYYAPVGRNEEILSELWATCINVEKKSVSRMDNFFDLGGDSITAMSLVQRLAKLGLRIHVTEIFKNPTLRAMAARVTTGIDESGQYERFSLVSSEERTRVIESVLADGCIEMESDVTDILPTTAFQAQIVRENMSPARRQLNHFAFNATGPCDTSHLTSAITQLVTKIESLRTGFAKTHRQKLLQVVYAKWEPTVRVFKTDKSPDAFYEETPEQDMFTEPSLARPMFDVAIIIAKANQQLRIVFRMSHALYDGATLHQVWAALEAIMAGQTIGNFAPVGPYFQSLRARTTNETEEYWGELVQGAAISSVSAHTEPRVSRLGIVSSKPIMLSRSRQFDFTLAVAVKTAWAIVLSHHVTSNDVVFADIMTGRTVVHPSVADVVACCARAVPCRVTCEPEWTIERLLEQIKQQQVDSMAHEGLELQQIAQRFMGWSEEVESDAPDMRVSMVNHTKAQKQNMSLGPTVYERVAVDLSNSYASVDFAIESVEQEDGSLSVGMAFASDRISQQLARTLSDRFQAVLLEIVEDPSCNVSHLHEMLRDSAMKN